MANKERNAEGYIRNHKILELFENLTAQLIFERPGEYSLRLLLNVFLSHFSLRLLLNVFLSHFSVDEITENP